MECPELVKDVSPSPYLQGAPMVAAPMNIQPALSQATTRQNKENVPKLIKIYHCLKCIEREIF